MGLLETRGVIQVCSFPYPIRNYIDVVLRTSVQRASQISPGQEVYLSVAL